MPQTPKQYEALLAGKVNPALPLPPDLEVVRGAALLTGPTLNLLEGAVVPSGTATGSELAKTPEITELANPNSVFPNTASSSELLAPGTRSREENGQIVFARRPDEGSGYDQLVLPKNLYACVALRLQLFLDRCCCCCCCCLQQCWRGQ